MQDDESALYNACTDLVSLKRCEVFPRQLLGNKPAGDWVRVRDFCADIGVASQITNPGLFATWLPDPLANDGYAVVMFYDDESKWSMAAHYNRGRLFGVAPRNGLLDPTEAAAPASTLSTPQQTTPAAKV